MPLETEYLKYIPTIFKNHYANAVTLTCIPALFYTAAAYSSQYLKGASMFVAIVISSIFAILEYVFRVPINFYSGKIGMSNFHMQMVWTVICLIFAKGSDILFPKML